MWLFLGSGSHLELDRRMPGYAGWNMHDAHSGSSVGVLRRVRPGRDYAGLRPFFMPLFTEVLRRISMKMSSRRAGLEGSFVTQHRPHDVDPPTRQGDESLSVSLALSPLALVEGPGLHTTSQTGKRRLVEDPL